MEKGRRGKALGGKGKRGGERAKTRGTDGDSVFISPLVVITFRERKKEKKKGKKEE